MGWITTYNDPKESAATFLRRRCLTWNLPPEQHPEAVATATGPSCIAFAVRFPAAYWTIHPQERRVLIPDLDGSITTAFVYLISGGERGSTQYNFGYKTMDETFGPNAPVSASILRHLSALDLANGGDSAQYAQAWRDRCKTYSASRSARATIKDGDHLTLAEPVSFNGFSASEFVVTTIPRRGRHLKVFRDVATGQLCHLSAQHLEGASFS